MESAPTALALVWDGSKLHGLNASGRAPAAWTPQRYAGRDSMPITGWDSVTVPGAVSGWVALSKRFGSLPFSDLFGPAIDYAERGYLVSPTVARQWEAQAPRFQSEQGFAEAFLPGGRAPRAGELFRFPAQARTLRLIAESGGDAFYRGELSAKMVAASQAQGGAMTTSDLGSHQADWVDPVSQGYRGLRLHEIPPNGQGIAALMALGMLEHFDIASLVPDSVDTVHLQLEAMKLAFADMYASCVGSQINARIQRGHAGSGLLEAACQANRSQACAGIRTWCAPEVRHRISRSRRCEREDGFLHPIELHGLRFRCRRARIRASPCKIAVRALSSRPDIQIK